MPGRCAWLLVASCLLASCGTSDGGEESSKRAIEPAETADDAVSEEAGSAEGEGRSLGPVAGAGAVSGAAAPAHFSDVYAIVAESCGGGGSGCHVGASPAMLPMHDVDSAYANLVDVASSKCASQLRVVPGDPDTSVLIGSLEGTMSCVKPMPLGRDPLGAEQITAIRSWIAAGAPRE